MWVMNPRIESSIAWNRTLKGRSTEIGQVRDIISKESSAEQIKHEVTALTIGWQGSFAGDSFVQIAKIHNTSWFTNIRARKATSHI